MDKLLLLVLLVIASLSWTTNVSGHEAVIKAEKNISPATEVEAAVLTLSDVSHDRKPYIRFFSSYAVPERLQQDTAYALSYVCHLLIGPALSDIDNAGGYYPIAKKINGQFVPIQRSKYSNTLYWIDLREYNWTEEVWEKLSLTDGYFVEPIVEHFSNSALRLIAGNAIVRADWFIDHATDLTRQADNEITARIYTDLLYAKNKTPKNLQEWLQIWGVPSVEKSRILGNEAGALVLRSQVARHNREVFSYRTELGWLYHTYDVKIQTGKRDYLENFVANRGKPPAVDDGGEGFSFNSVGMLTAFMIRNGQNEFVEFGDPTLVYHLQDITGDPRVRTATSCMDCHSSGPIPPRNIVKEYLKEMADIKIYDYSDKLRVERAFLSDKFEDAVTDGQLYYARSLLKVNGLTPEENGKAYLNIISWYRQPLSLEQVLVECGIDEKEFFKRIQLTKEVFSNPKIPARLAVLLVNNELIPRDIWESPGRDGIPGTFQQTMIALYGITRVTDSVTEVPLTYTVVVSRCNIYHGTTIIQTAIEGETLEYLGKVSEDGRWLLVKYKNQTGWIKKEEAVK